MAVTFVGLEAGFTTNTNPVTGLGGISGGQQDDVAVVHLVEFGANASQNLVIDPTTGWTELNSGNPIIEDGPGAQYHKHYWGTATRGASAFNVAVDSINGEYHVACLALFRGAAEPTVYAVERRDDNTNSVVIPAFNVADADSMALLVVTGYDTDVGTTPFTNEGWTAQGSNDGNWTRYFTKAVSTNQSAVTTTETDNTSWVATVIVVPPEAGGAVSGTALGSWGAWSGTASASKDVSGTSAGSWSWVATSSSSVEKFASSAANWSWTATATGSGFTTVAGTALGSWGSWVSAASSTTSVGATAIGTWGSWTAAGSALKEVLATTAGPWNWSAIAVGGVEKFSTAAGPWSWNATAVGTVSTPGWGAPQNVVATSTGTTTIQITWDAVPTATGYDIERNGAIVAFDHAASPFNDSGLIPDTLYTYRVRAVAPA